MNSTPMAIFASVLLVTVALTRAEPKAPSLLSSSELMKRSYPSYESRYEPREADSGYRGDRQAPQSEEASSDDAYQSAPKPKKTVILAIPVKLALQQAQQQASYEQNQDQGYIPSRGMSYNDQGKEQHQSQESYRPPTYTHGDGGGGGHWRDNNSYHGGGGYHQGINHYQSNHNYHQPYGYPPPPPPNYTQPPNYGPPPPNHNYYQPQPYPNSGPPNYSYPHGSNAHYNNGGYNYPNYVGSNYAPHNSSNLGSYEHNYNPSNQNYSYYPPNYNGNSNVQMQPPSFPPPSVPPPVPSPVPHPASYNPPSNYNNGPSNYGSNNNNNQYSGNNQYNNNNNNQQYVPQYSGNNGPSSDRHQNSGPAVHQSSSSSKNRPSSDNGNSYENQGNSKSQYQEVSKYQDQLSKYSDAGKYQDGPSKGSMEDDSPYAEQEPPTSRPYTGNAQTYDMPKRPSYADSRPSSKDAESYDQESGYESDMEEYRPSSSKKNRKEPSSYTSSIPSGYEEISDSELYSAARGNPYKSSMSDGDEYNMESLSSLSGYGSGKESSYSGKALRDYAEASDLSPFEYESLGSSLGSADSLSSLPYGSAFSGSSLSSSLASSGFPSSAFSGSPSLSSSADLSLLYASSKMPRAHFPAPVFPTYGLRPSPFHHPGHRPYAAASTLMPHTSPYSYGRPSVRRPMAASNYYKSYSPYGSSFAASTPAKSYLPLSSPSSSSLPVSTSKFNSASSTPFKIAGLKIGKGGKGSAFRIGNLEFGRSSIFPSIKIKTPMRT